MCIRDRCFKYLKIRSKETKVLQLPKWTVLYTVGPHTYIPTTLLFIVEKTSFCDVRELYIFKSLFDDDIVKTLAYLTNII